MRNKLYKSILLFTCLFISTTVINAATGSGSAALVNIRNTSIGRSSSKIAGYYNTTYIDTTKSYEEIFNKTYKAYQNGWNEMENTLWSNYKCKVTKNSITKNLIVVVHYTVKIVVRLVFTVPMMKVMITATIEQ